jgi:hypothetical protein
MTAPLSREEQCAVLAELYVGRRENLYITTKNPIHAWAAYRIARHLGVPIADWVLAYFDTAAKSILETDLASSSTRIAIALGLASQREPSAAKRANTKERNLAIVDAVMVFHRDPMLDELAFAEVAERFHVSAATVKRIYSEMTVSKHKPAQSRR